MSLISRASISRASTSLSAARKSMSATSPIQSQIRRSLGGRLLEVRAGPAAQVLRLADVDDPPLGVLHQVDAGRGRELADLLARIEGLRWCVGHGCLAGSFPVKRSATIAGNQYTRAPPGRKRSAETRAGDRESRIFLRDNRQDCGYPGYDRSRRRSTRTPDIPRPVGPSRGDEHAPEPARTPLPMAAAHWARRRHKRARPSHWRSTERP